MHNSALGRVWNFLKPAVQSLQTRTVKFLLKISSSVKAPLTLSAEDQDTLHNLLISLEKHVGQPLFVDLVINPQAKRISVLQIDPLELPATKNAQYVVPLKEDTMERFPNELQVIETIDILQTIGWSWNRSRVRVITHKNQILCAPTIEEALLNFNNKVFDRDVVEVIAVEKPAGENSYAASRFMSKNKVVILLKKSDIDTLSYWLNHNYPFIIDAQQDRILCLSHTTKHAVQNFSLEQLAASGAIKEKRLHHPLPLKLTIKNNSTLDPSVFEMYRSFEANVAHVSLRKLVGSR